MGRTEMGLEFPKRRKAWEDCSALRKPQERTRRPRGRQRRPVAGESSQHIGQQEPRVVLWVDCGARG